jgi:CheY-like chemotaxis protein
MASDRPAEGRRVLVVEDEFSIAVMIEGTLAALGAEVVGPTAWMDEGMKLATEELVDGAVLDINIQGGTSYPVADILAERGIPFLFCSGYGEWVIVERHRDRPRLTKPFTATDLQVRVLHLLANGRG